MLCVVCAYVLRASCVLRGGVYSILITANPGFCGLYMATSSIYSSR